MTIDLDRLWEPHPDHFRRSIEGLAHNPALALQRRHVPGVALAAKVDGTSLEHAIAWTLVPEATRIAVDEARATEDGAEGVGLGLVHAVHGWTLRRRLQRRQYGDWLVVEATSGRHVVLEIGGLDRGSITRKLEGEMAQVSRCPLAYDRAACVVRFHDVAAILVEIPHGPR